MFQKNGVEIERVLYVDTDILFLKSLDDIWLQFQAFNSSHLAAMVSESPELLGTGWYKISATHPFYGTMGK